MLRRIVLYFCVGVCCGACYGGQAACYSPMQLLCTHQHCVLPPCPSSLCVPQAKQDAFLTEGVVLLWFLRCIIWGVVCCLGPGHVLCCCVNQSALRAALLP
jgi:hypothetical protein